MADSIAVTALSYALAALADNSGGSGSSTVSIKVSSNTITAPPGEPGKVINLGTEQNVILQFTVPQGLNGGQWYISSSNPGEIVKEAVDGDLILYFNGDIYQVDKGIPIYKNINIVGKNGFSPTITEKINTKEEYILTIINENKSYDTPNLKKASILEDGLVIDGGLIEN